MTTTIFRTALRHRTSLRLAAAACAAAALAGCTVGRDTASAAPETLDEQAVAMMRAGFRDEGIAKVDRLNQDAMQAACSRAEPPDAATAKAIEAQATSTLQWPAGGRYVGDWREGEKLAQNGRGLTWTDASIAPSANGGSCYNCHQIDRKEISFGTLGPSLWNYGKLRGVTDVADPKTAAIVQYTWSKLWNAKATNACSNMPRFGHLGLLDATQIAHLTALLLDPRSPVNQ